MFVIVQQIERGSPAGADAEMAVGEVFCADGEADVVGVEMLRFFVVEGAFGFDGEQSAVGKTATRLDFVIIILLMQPVFVGEKNRDFGVLQVDFQIPGSADAAFQIAASLGVKQFDGQVHSFFQNCHGTQAAMQAQFVVARRFVASDLRSIQAEKQASFEALLRLGMDGLQGKTEQ